MAKKILLSISVLICAICAFGQSPVEIRSAGEQKIANGETAESAKRWALYGATRTALLEASARLQAFDEVTALKLTPAQVNAFTMTIVEPQEQPPQAAAAKGVVHVDVLARLDLPAAANRLRRLRKDQEAANALTETWKEMEELHRQLVEPAGSKTSQERQILLTKLQVKLMAAQVTAALAKTEESLTSARIPLPDGKARAKRIAEAAIATAPDFPDAHYAMGDVLTDADDGEPAEAEYRKALAADSSSAAGHIKLAGAMRVEGKLPEAVTELREALRLDPNSVLAHSDLGLILAAQQNNADAMTEYHEAIRLDRDWIDAHNNLAIALARQRRIPEAVIEFREIVRIDPDSAMGYYNLGIALADMEKDAESAEALREAVRINPNHYNAHFDLGELFRLESKFDEAVKQFKEYLRLAPDNPQTQRSIKRAKDFIQAHENQ
ncbi:MAG TPA: tetratricopeptide repeat protein [Terriglobia bacterium]|jgi:tetratricopeptide (TPR) repeat protein